MGDVAGVHRIRGDNNDAMPGRHCASLDEALALFAGEPLLFRPGTEYRYSIYGWVLFPAAMRTGLGVEVASPAPYSCLAGAGAFLSTLSDLVRFGSAMLKPGLLKAETIAAGGTISLMMFPDLGLVIAAPSNVTHAKGVAPLGQKVAEAFARPAEGADSIDRQPV